MTPIRPRLVLVHGWGFEPGFWQGLRGALPDYEIGAVDFGYYGPPAGPALPPDRPVIAIGHSLGSLWLLKTRPFLWQGLVAINGFPRFTAEDDYQPAVAPRVIDRMIRRLAADPAGVVEEFRHRCGATGPLPDGPVPDSLLQGLSWLRDWDARQDLTGPNHEPILALSGGQDPILPEGMDEHCFTGFPDVRRARLDTAGHLLPVTDPDWCAERIRAFLAELNPGS